MICHILNKAPKYRQIICMLLDQAHTPIRFTIYTTVANAALLLNAAIILVLSET